MEVGKEKMKIIPKEKNLSGMILIRELGRQEGSKARKIRYVLVKLVTFSQGGAKKHARISPLRHFLLAFPLKVK